MDADLVELSQTLGSVSLRDFDSHRRILYRRLGGASNHYTAAGSSAWFERGFVTYANEAKVDMLGVRQETLAGFGAVSPETAAEMASGALKNSRALISLAITGIAGPTGGSPGKPVGTVCFAWCRAGAVAEAEVQVFSGDREAIRRQAVVHALRGLLLRIDAY